MNKTTYEERLKAFRERINSIGATFDHSFYDENHLDCFWYDGSSIAEVEYKGYTICFDVCGDISIAIYAEQDYDSEPLCLKHKGGSQSFFRDDECREIIADDEMLYSMIHDDRLIFDNNNWINIVVVKKHGDTWDTVSEPEVADDSVILAAIEKNLDFYIKYIDSLEEKADETETNKPETNLTTSLRDMYEESLKELDNEQHIVYLSVDQLFPHPDNPRKDLGDLSELADSIKANGVLQNLTVVPRGKDEYTIIIGHRRHAASAIAGRKTVPCVITEMTQQEQLATMLLENIQRSDLTPYEQAKAFQLMMDFGESVDTIAEKTGFSNTTVRRRLKMAELDEKTLKKVSERQLSITDFDRLAEIEDLTKRNAVLADIGTKNFENKLINAVNEQKTEKTRKAILEELVRRNIKDISTANIPGTLRSHVCYISPETYINFLDSLKPGIEYFYENTWGTNFHLYKHSDAAKTEEELAREKEVEERRSRSKMLREVAERAFNLRWNFVKKFSKSEAKKYIPEITEFLLRDSWDVRNYHSYRSDHVLKIFGIKETVGQKSYDMIAEKVSVSPEYALLVQAYASYSDGATRDCFNHMNEYVRNKELEELYTFLAKLGYEISDEEQQMLDGTLSLYAKKEN